MQKIKEGSILSKWIEIRQVSIDSCMSTVVFNILHNFIKFCVIILSEGGERNEYGEGIKRIRRHLVCHGI